MTKLKQMGFRDLPKVFAASSFLWALLVSVFLSGILSGFQIVINLITAPIFGYVSGFIFVLFYNYIYINIFDEIEIDK